MNNDWPFVTVRFTRNTRYVDGLRQFGPHEDLIVTPYGIDALLLAERTNGVELIADHYPTEDVTWWRPGSAARNVGFTQCGGMGDELILSAFLWQMHYKDPLLQTTNYAELNNLYMAFNGPSNVFPLQLGLRPPDFRRYDAWVMPRPVGYLSRGTSTNIYHQFAEELGVVSDFNRPNVSLSTEEIEDVWTLLAALPDEFRRSFVLVQLSANDDVRSPAGWPVRLRWLMDALDARSPRTWVAVVGNRSEVGLVRFRSGLTHHPRLVDLPFGMGHASLSPRSVLYLASVAECVVTPDSMALHGAAAFNTPTVALWNLGNGGSVADRPDRFPPEKVPMQIATALARASNPYLSVCTEIGNRPEDVAPPPSARTATYPNVTVVDMADEPTVMAEAVCSVLSNCNIYVPS